MLQFYVPQSKQELSNCKDGRSWLARFDNFPRT